MEQKIKRSTLALYGVFAIHVLSSVISIAWYFHKTSELNIPDYMMTNPVQLFGMSIAWSVFLGIAIVKTVEHLKEKNEYAWIAAISIFVITMFGYALPVSLIGLLSLMDQEVRSHFLQKLEIKI